MRKRRERIEKWRNEKKLKEQAEQPKNQVAGKTWNLEDDDENDDDEDEETKSKKLGNMTIEGAIAKQHCQIKRDEIIHQKQEEQQIQEQIARERELLIKQQAQQNEEDPLDAYMKEITKAAKTLINQSKKGNVVSSVKAKTGAVVQEEQKEEQKEEAQTVVVTKMKIVEGAAKVSKDKGDIMEQDIDGLEDLSEEDDGIPEGEDATTLKPKNKSDQISTDHNKIFYREFRKKFYVEVPEIKEMTPEEVEAYRVELEGISIRGKNCPKPIKSWAQCGVSRKVLDCLKKNGFEKPTPIQAQGLPVIMSGRDMIGIAKTGSGKTLGFVMPMLRHILDQPPLEGADGPIAIVMTPTRELAMQIAKECKKFTKHLDLRVVSVYGGAGISEQIAELKRGAEIIVCTPGRMIDMLAANNGRVTNLRRVTYVVLDEADRMFDLGFEPQVTKILESVRPDRQTVMFSATFPRQMEALARRVLNKPIEITIGGRSVVCKDVEQHIMLIEEDDKYLKLLELLGIYQEKGSVLVFVDKQEAADELMKKLLKNSYPCMSLHGGIDQSDRESTISDFKNANIPLLIATSVAARGLDVKELILVVNYDVPNHYEDYVHRCGRTGRAGRKGYAYTFITTDQVKYVGDIINALELSETEIPDDLKLLWDNYVKEMEAVSLPNFIHFQY